MKGLLNYIIALIILNAGISCKGSDITPLPDNSCVDAGETVVEISNKTGRVFYHDDTQQYFLSYHVPETYDLLLTGIVCNMPENFPKTEDYIEVTFSGRYTEMKSIPGTCILGNDMYYLVLSNITY